MGTMKESALGIAAALAAAHTANPESPELDALHGTLNTAMGVHADELGFDEDDLAEIRGVLTAARGGGTPKPE